MLFVCLWWNVNFYFTRKMTTLSNWDIHLIYKTHLKFICIDDWLRKKSLHLIISPDLTLLDMLSIYHPYAVLGSPSWGCNLKPLLYRWVAAAVLTAVLECDTHTSHTHTSCFNARYFQLALKHRGAYGIKQVDFAWISWKWRFHDFESFLVLVATHTHTHTHTQLVHTICETRGVLFRQQLLVWTRAEREGLPSFWPMRFHGWPLHYRADRSSSCGRLGRVARTAGPIPSASASGPSYSSNWTWTRTAGSMWTSCGSGSPPAGCRRAPWRR